MPNPSRINRYHHTLRTKSLGRSRDQIRERVGGIRLVRPSIALSKMFNQLPDDQFHVNHCKIKKFFELYQVEIIKVNRGDIS